MLLDYDTGYFCIFVKYTFELILISRLQRLCYLMGVLFQERVTALSSAVRQCCCNHRLWLGWVFLLRLFLFAAKPGCSWRSKSSLKTAFMFWNEVLKFQMSLLSHKTISGGLPRECFLEFRRQGTGSMSSFCPGKQRCSSRVCWFTSWWVCFGEVSRFWMLSKWLKLILMCKFLLLSYPSCVSVIMKRETWIWVNDHRGHFSP